MVINVHEAKTHLSRLLDRVADGEELVLGKAGKPMARLIPYKTRSRPRKPGALAGRITIAADVDDADESLIADFEGEE